jgi:putative transcriptional regulator
LRNKNQINNKLLIFFKIIGKISKKIFNKKISQITLNKELIDRRKSNKFNTFALYAIFMSKKAINRLKVVLAEKNLTSKWLAEQLGKNEATISRWCTNDVQPSLKTLVEIAKILEVYPSDLINNNESN